MDSCILVGWPERPFAEYDTVEVYGIHSYNEISIFVQQSQCEYIVYSEGLGFD